MDPGAQWVGSENEHVLDAFGYILWEFICLFVTLFSSLPLPFALLDMHNVKIFMTFLSLRFFHEIKF